MESSPIEEFEETKLKQLVSNHYKSCLLSQTQILILVIITLKVHLIMIYIAYNFNFWVETWIIERIPITRIKLWETHIYIILLILFYASIRNIIRKLW